jgi:hypothetical protein
MNTVNRLCKAAIVAGATLSLLADNNTGVAPFLNLRPAGRDLAGKIVGTTSHHTHLYGMETWYGFGDIRFKYGQSFKPNNISRALFGPALVNNSTTSTTISDNSNQIVVSGSAITGTRGTYDLMAENFYLPRDFKSTLTFKPKVQRFQVDFDFRINLDEWSEGLYLEFWGPFVNERRNLDFEETINAAGTTGYAAGYFDTAAVASTSLLTSFASYANGVGTIKTTTVKADYLQYAKFDNERHSRSEFGELRALIGYDVLLDEDYHLGLSFQAAAPTGRRPSAEFLFEPTATNGKHWEVGGGISGHYTMWRSENEEKHFDFIVEADFTHLLKARQRRTFDLNGKPLSRYMLAEKMQKTDAILLAGATEGAATAPTYQFAAEFAPVANVTTLDVKTSVGVQADVVGMFNFTCKGFTWDLGYEFFGGSSEKIDAYDSNDSDDNRLTFAANTWALKGNASVYGYNVAVPEALSATNNTATVFNSTIGSSVVNNTGVDNTNLAWATASSANLALFTVPSGSTQINTSNPPVLIALTDLNMEGAETKLQSHKIFTHLGYTWVDREDWVPFIGVGAEVEFGRRHDVNATTTTTTTTTSTTSGSINCALSQWGVWLKGGISFN